MVKITDNCDSLISIISLMLHYKVFNTIIIQFKLNIFYIKYSHTLRSLMKDINNKPKKIPLIIYVVLYENFKLNEDIMF